MSLRSAIRSGRVLRTLAAIGLVTGTTVVAAVAAPAAYADDFGPAGSSPIHPGVMATSPQGQCTVNFVFTAGDKVLLGQAAHCTGTGSDSETNGCTSKSAPLGTEVKVQGASHPAKLVYNSWLTMQDRGEKDKNTCAYNDFALLEVDSSDVHNVNPSVPVFGGPTGLRTSGLSNGAKVYSYQNSSLRPGGLMQTSAKTGVSLGDSGAGREHSVATVSPGVPGDSGSGFMDASGNAFGVLSTLNLDPAPGTNGVADLAKALDYANQYGDLGDIQLERGTQPFSGGGPLPAL
jgi:hypothetical protein